MTNHILVTGGTGFIGQHTLAALTQRGHHTHTLMRQPSRLKELRHAVHRLGGEPDRVHSIKGDLAQPGLGWQQTTPDTLRSVNRVLHLGALFDWRLAPKQARIVNTEGSGQIVRWCADQGAEMVMVSGFMTHNRQHLTTLGIDPDSGEASWDRVYRRAGAYEASKLESYFLVRDMATALDVPLTLVNPGTVAGHSETGELASGQPLAMLIENLAAGRMTAAPGSNAHWLPLIAVDTLAQILARCVEDTAIRGQSLIALDPTTPDWPTTLSHLADALGVTSPRLYLPKELVKATLRLPGLERLMGTPREALDFIQTARFDTSELTRFNHHHELVWPAMERVLERTARQMLDRHSIRPR